MYDKIKNEPYEQYLKVTQEGGKEIKYLPWAICWDMLKKYFPNSKYEWVIADFDGKKIAGAYQPNGSFIIHCKITIKHEGETYIHNEYCHTEDKTPENDSYDSLDDVFRKTLAKGVSMMTGFGIKLWFDK